MSAHALHGQPRFGLFGCWTDGLHCAPNARRERRATELHAPLSSCRMERQINAALQAA